jgi:hypothetical protein
MSEYRSVAKKYLKRPNLGNIKEAYLELTGETNPQLSSLPELKVVGDTGSYTWSAPDAHIYEYLWTISLTSPQAEKKGKKEESILEKRWIRKLRKNISPKRDWTHMLRKRDGVLIQIFFHTYKTPYLVRVLTTTLKPPFVIKKTITDKVREVLTATRSIRKLAKTGVPGKFGTLLDAVGILEEDSVPNYQAYPWYSKTITAPEKAQERGLEGVEFSLDRKVFRNIGNRVMGSLGIMFICKSELKGQKHPPVKLEARAIMFFKESKESKVTGGRIWIPEKKGFGKNAFFSNRLFLEINPKPPKSN